MQYFDTKEVTILNIRGLFFGWVPTRQGHVSSRRRLCVWMQSHVKQASYV